MSRHLDAETVSSFWTDIQKATAQSNHLAGGQVAQRVPPMSGSDASHSQAAANALLASLTQSGLNSQRLAHMQSAMYPPAQFDSGTLPPQALARVDEALLPIGSHQLQQHQQSANQQLASGKISSSEAFPAHLQAAMQPAPQPSASDSEEEGRTKGGVANGDRKSQLKEKNRKAQKRFRERQKVRQTSLTEHLQCQAVPALLSEIALMQSKLAESEEKVAAMAVQLEQLHSDRLRLENRNSVLEKVLPHQVGLCMVCLQSTESKHVPFCATSAPAYFPECLCRTVCCHAGAGDEGD